MSGVPESYLQGLTPSQRLLQARLLSKSAEHYQRTGKVLDRPNVSQKATPRSTHAKEFQEKYGFTVTNLSRVKKEFPDTNTGGILSKGAAAYATSGSRPNVSSFAWKFARLASVLTGGKAYKIDKDLVGAISRRKIYG